MPLRIFIIEVVIVCGVLQRLDLHECLIVVQVDRLQLQGAACIDDP